MNKRREEFNFLIKLIPKPILNIISEYDYYFEGKLCTALTGHNHGISYIKLLLDRYLVSISVEPMYFQSKKTTKVWDLKTGILMSNFGSISSSFLILQNGQFLTINSRNINLRSLYTGSAIQVINFSDLKINFRDSEYISPLFELSNSAIIFSILSDRIQNSTTELAIWDRQNTIVKFETKFNLKNHNPLFLNLTSEKFVILDSRYLRIYTLNNGILKISPPDIEISLPEIKISRSDTILFLGDMIIFTIDAELYLFDMTDLHKFSISYTIKQIILLPNSQILCELDHRSGFKVAIFDIEKLAFNYDFSSSDTNLKINGKLPDSKFLLLNTETNKLSLLDLIENKIDHNILNSASFCDTEIISDNTLAIICARTHGDIEIYR